MNETESLPRSVQRYTGILRRQWWVVTLVTVVAIAAAALYVERATPVYSASSKVIVGQEQTLFNPALSVNYQAFTSTISSLLQSNVVARSTIAQLGLKTTPTALLANLGVSAQPDGAVIDVSYDDTDQARAVRVLSAIGTIFTSLVNNKLAGGQTPPAAPTTSSPTVTPATQPVSAVVFDPAHRDPGQVSPHVTRSVAIALVLGLIGGVLLAFLRDALSSTVESESDVESLYHAPSLGALPRGALGIGVFQLGALPRKPRVRLTAAFKMLSARLRYSTSIEQGVIVVTSARPEDGKSTVAAHLAAEFALSGKEVIAVEADLHRPALHRLFDLDPDQLGITDLRMTNGALTTRLIDVEAPSAPVPAPSRRQRRQRRAEGHRQTTVIEEDLGPSIDPDDVEATAGGRLRLLPAGRDRSGQSSSNALSLGNASSLIMRLRKMADYVVVDTPPLLLSGDGYPLLQLADAVVVVCRRGATRQHQAAEAEEILRSLGVEKFSVVLTEADSVDREYYGYEPSS